MLEAFQVYTHSLSRLWPVRLFAKEAEGDGFVELHRLDAAADAILLNLGVYVYEIVDSGIEIDVRKLRFIKIKNLISIQGPIRYKESNQLAITDILSLSEATKLWGLKDSSTLRKAMDRDKFFESEMRKADNIWLITYPAMQRVFDARTLTEMKDEKYPAILIKEGEREGEWGIEENDKVSPKYESPFKKYRKIDGGDTNG
ncbi:helix-turn-helix domain-containing protein [Bacillus sp. B190/17]|uniref:Helix-turn-helix domain-containing protein n=1 Tax=Bacillus lumedeiriae TaxID=3058829 RepID=A0ABW8IEU2_9BACI